MSRKKSSKTYGAMIRALRKTEVVDEYGEVKHYNLTGKTFTASEGYDLRKIGKLTPAQKAKVTRYFDELHRQTASSQPLHIYKPRRKDRIKKALHLVGAKRFPGFTGVFVQSPTPERPRIKETARGTLKVVDPRGVSSIPVYFDKRQMAIDAAREILRAINEQAPNSEYYKIQAGRFIMEKATYTIHDIAEEVIKLQGAYNRVRPDGTLDAHHHSKWLHGVIAYSGKEDIFHSVDTLNKEAAERKREYRKKQHKEYKRLQRERIKAEKAAKRKAKR